jgi:hypothetical protein
LLTLDRLTNIIALGEQLDVEFKPDRLVNAHYGLTADEIAVVEGKQ